MGKKEKTVQVRIMLFRMKLMWIIYVYACKTCSHCLLPKCLANQNLIPLSHARCDMTGPVRSSSSFLHVLTFSITDAFVPPPHLHHVTQGSCCC